MIKASLLSVTSYGLIGTILLQLSLQAYSQTEGRTFTHIYEYDAAALLLSNAPPTKFTTGFTVSFVEVRQPVPGYTSGVTISSGEVAWSSDWCVLKISSELQGEPSYRKPEPSVQHDRDYDSSGKLMIAHTEAQYFICTKDRSDRLDVVRRYGVDPNGTVYTNKTPWMQMLQFPIGDRNSLYLFRQLIQATGRGFAQDLTSLISEKSLDNKIQVDAKGGAGPWLPGHWVLTCDRGSDPLVRTATFYTDAMPDQPNIEISNSGEMSCRGLTFARDGQLRIGPLNTKFEIVNVEPLESSDALRCPLYREVIKHFEEPLPTGSQIVDRRTPKTTVNRTK